MTAPNDRVPIRTCVGCRAKRPQAELVRCVIAADGCAHVDRHAPGRGAWLCGAACLEPAIRRRGFERAWRIDGRITSAALDALRRELPGTI